MKRSRQAAAVLVAGLLLVSCQRKASWRDYTAPDGRFTISLPGAPRVGVTPAQGLDGATQHTVRVRAEGQQFVVSYSDFPGDMGNPEELIVVAHQAATTNLKAPKTIGDKPWNVQGRPGREFRVSTPDAVYVSRFVMVPEQRRLYQLLVVTPEEKLQSPAVGQFLESFKLRDAPVKTGA